MKLWIKIVPNGQPSDTARTLLLPFKYLLLFLYFMLTIIPGTVPGVLFGEPDSNYITFSEWLVDLIMEFPRKRSRK